MATRAEHKHTQDKHDAATLEEAVRVIRRRRIIPVGYSQASVCRLLENEAAAIRRSLNG